MSDRVRRAAHGKHVCQLCRRHIAARTQYHDVRIAYDGTAFTWREHVECREFMYEHQDWWDANEGYDFATFDELSGVYPRPLTS